MSKEDQSAQRRARVIINRLRLAATPSNVMIVVLSIIVLIQLTRLYSTVSAHSHLRGKLIPDPTWMPKDPKNLSMLDEALKEMKLEAERRERNAKFEVIQQEEEESEEDPRSLFFNGDKRSQGVRPGQLRPGSWAVDDSAEVTAMEGDAFQNKINGNGLNGNGQLEGKMHGKAGGMGKRNQGRGGGRQQFLEFQGMKRQGQASGAGGQRILGNGGRMQQKDGRLSTLKSANMFTQQAQQSADDYEQYNDYAEDDYEGDYDYGQNNEAVADDRGIGNTMGRPDTRAGALKTGVGAWKGAQPTGRRGGALHVAETNRKTSRNSNQAFGLNGQQVGLTQENMDQDSGMIRPNPKGNKALRGPRRGRNAQVPQRVRQRVQPMRQHGADQNLQGNTMDRRRQFDDRMNTLQSDLDNANDYDYAGDDANQELDLQGNEDYADSQYEDDLNNDGTLDDSRGFVDQERAMGSRAGHGKGRPNINGESWKRGL